MPRTLVRPGPSNASAHARDIAEYAIDAWRERVGAGEVRLPVSAIAALSLISVPDHTPNELAAAVLELNAQGTADLIRSVWRGVVQARPDLLNPIWPLMGEWMNEEHPISEDYLTATHHLVQAAVRRDLFGLTATDRRHDADLLGSLLTATRSLSAMQGLGQFYTPASVSDLIARMTMTAEQARAGMRISDPAAGTGGLFRAAAQAIREYGGDPARSSWTAVDIDPVGIACLAVNVISWGLGHDVLLGVGNTLTNDWQDEAVQRRRETVELARVSRMISALASLTSAAEPDEAVAVTRSAEEPAENADPAPARSGDADEPMDLEQLVTRYIADNVA